jgi:hypothetical protein
MLQSQNKPNLFIIGAPKAGTTFLFEKLKNSNDFFFPKLKELNYFSFNDLNEKSYYNDYKVNTLDKYLSFYKNTESAKYVIDGSVSYFTSENALKDIASFNTESKIIIILRNPIQRAFSHYQMDKRMGHATKNFKDYLKDKSDRHYHEYVENSLYFKNIEIATKYFSAKNIMILTLEEISKNLDKLSTFLELNLETISEKDLGEKINENKAPKNFLGRMMQKNRKLVSILKIFIPKKISDKIKSPFYEDAKKEFITEEEYSLIYNILRDDIENLSLYLNVKLMEFWKINKNG